jgi:hypothetical protein
MADVNATACRASASFDIFGVLARFAPLIFLVVLMAVFATLEPRFLSSVNLFNVMRQVSIVGLLAVGMTFIILTAGIDLSIGSLLALCGLVAAAVAKGGLESRFTVGAGAEAAGYGWELALLPRCGRRSSAGSARLCDHPAESAAFRSDARRHVGVPRRSAPFRGRRADQRFPAGLHLVGPGADRARPRARHHLHRLCHPRPQWCCATPATDARLCGGRQPGSGAPVRA